jgi:hypothetical protein
MDHLLSMRRQRMDAACLQPAFELSLSKPRASTSTGSVRTARVGWLEHPNPPFGLSLSKPRTRTSTSSSRTARAARHPHTPERAA